VNQVEGLPKKTHLQVKISNRAIGALSIVDLAHVDGRKCPRENRKLRIGCSGIGMIEVSRPHSHPA